ncbi:MAG TPA: sugar transferase [Candidatus Brocadiia bacterium]|nr:exopolysaccharide biosynthesis polyprenyl glycosylphosphotransferase [Planctomycetota bacterium]MBI4007680.1 exopolysaccharide biosynthesis polyprenyl glycosylphosphotransferase [Planctomycetota bacterium]MDO8094499.1 exopolysaccharide biosynthesis polyprenyl glycosylphosphotransferase [Candidatus Brocadiales bacterium]
MIIVTDRGCIKEIEEAVSTLGGPLTSSSNFRDEKHGSISPNIIIYEPDNGCPRKNSPQQQSSLSKQLSAILNSNGSKGVIFASPHLTYDIITDVILNCPEKPHGFKILRHLYEKTIGRVRRTSSICNLCVVDLLKENLSASSRWSKRCIDIVLSIIALILFSPVLVIVSVLIKLTSKGPVIFTQMRAGLNGKPFKLYKFRTMVSDADRILQDYIDINKLKEPVYKFRKDKRVTPLGRILRKTSIDELPQIFNVFKGDMSWVGPRPEDVRIVKCYNAVFKTRLMAKPGITGLQQIKCRGINSMTERIKYDNQYIEKQSVWLDLKILFRTIKVVLSREGAW